MGQPAARVGDTTAHGGSITLGAPTVTICGMPAARIGDMHVCPLQTPGTPPIPHVGGPVNIGSPVVTICGMPAARVGDMAVCVGPPDSIVTGAPTVTIGGPSAGAPVPSMAQATAAVSASVAGSAPDTEEESEHFIDVRFNDSAKQPVVGLNYNLAYPDDYAEEGTLPTRLIRRGVPEGQYTIALQVITGVRWSVQEARDDDTVQCLVETFGFEDGAPATLDIRVKNLNRPDRIVQSVDDLTIENGSLSYEWQPSFFSEMEGDQEDTGFLAPSFFFTVTIAGQTERSGLLTYRDFIELELFNENEQPVANAHYSITLSSGETRSGTLDDNGHARVDNIPPGNCRVEFPGMVNAG